MARMAAGDTDAAAVFVGRFKSRVYGLALSVLNDSGRAEETAQEAFIRAWRHSASYDPRRGRVDTWLLTITRNLAVDAIRLRREHPVDPERLLSVLVASEDGETRAVEAEGATALRASLGVLPPEQGRPVVLSVFYGLTAKEIADREGIPLGTAKTRIRRGLAKLRAGLEVAGD